MVVNRKPISIFLYLLVYILLIIGYRIFIVQVYEYSGFIWNVDLIRIIEGCFLVSIVVFFLPVNFSKSSDILLHIQFLFPILPMLVLYGAESQPRAYMYATVLSFLIVVLVASRLRLKSIVVTRKVSPLLFQRILLLVGWIVITIIILFGGWRYFNLDIARVYEYRSLAAANLPSLFSYISPLVSKVIFPFSLLIAFVRRERTAALLSVAGSVMMFALTAHKGPLFYPFVVMFLYYMLKQRDVVKWLILGYSMLITLSVMLYALFGHILFGSLMLRRVIFVPAQINFHYYDFFSNNPFVYWARSKITFRLLDYAYQLDVPHLIGLYYFNSSETGANTGWIGSGYGNAGYVGMFICAIIIGVFLALLNSYGKAIDKKIVTSIVTAPLFAVFMSSDIFTAFLTHGALLVLLLFTIFPLANFIGKSSFRVYA